LLSRMNAQRRSGRVIASWRREILCMWIHHVWGERYVVRVKVRAEGIEKRISLKSAITRSFWNQ
jgi:hypothetical protein